MVNWRRNKKGVLKPMQRQIEAADKTVGTLYDLIKKARFMSNKLHNEFFSYEQLETQQDINEIMLGYDDATYGQDILNDYLVQMENYIVALMSIIDKMPLNPAYVKEGDTDAE